MNLRRGDCGHWIPEDVPPAGEHVGAGHSPIPVYLCDDCVERVKRHGPRIETKTVEGELLSRPQDFMPKAVQPIVETAGTPTAVKEDGPPYHDRRSTVPAYELGQMAAREGKTEDPPYLDRRTKEAKEWLRGYREARSGGETTSDPG